MPYLPFGFFHEMDTSVCSFCCFFPQLSKSIYPQELALPEVATGFNTFALWTYVNASDPAEQSTLLDYMDRCELAHVKVD